MNKSKFCATYNGQGYIRGYGRKFYKKGIEFINVTNCDDKIVVDKMRTPITKSLEKCVNMEVGTKIEFYGVLIEDKISYISNVIVIERK